MGMNKWAAVSLACAACIIVGLVTSSGVSQPASGGAVAGGRAVATIDIVRIFNETAQIKDLNEHMRQKTEDYAAELKQRSEALNAKRLEFQAFKPGTTDYDTRRKELMKMNADAMAWSKATEDDLDLQKFDWTVEIYKLATESAAKVAQARGFDVVVQKTEFKPGELQERNVQSLRGMIQSRVVIFSVPEVDITEDVIRTMDQTYRASKPIVRPPSPQIQPPTPATRAP